MKNKNNKAKDIEITKPEEATILQADYTELNKAYKELNEEEAALLAKFNEDPALWLLAPQLKSYMLKRANAVASKNFVPTLCRKLGLQQSESITEMVEMIKGGWNPHCEPQYIKWREEALYN